MQTAMVGLIGSNALFMRSAADSCPNILVPKSQPLLVSELRAARAIDSTVDDLHRGGLPSRQRGTLLLALLAYSDGSVIAAGVEGSAAAVVWIRDTDVSATVRLATGDRALSLGRSEWAGLLVVLCILRRVRADVTLRLGNLQVVNGYGDGEHRFAHGWLRRNERDMATLAWEVAAERERLGFGTIVVLHQLGHPEKRKKPVGYDEHGRYNAKVDALTHAHHA